MLIIMHCSFYFKRNFLQFLSPSSFGILFYSFEDLVSYFLIFYFEQKSPAKKLSHAISKSLGCVPTREPPHPVFPEQPEKPLDLANIV